MTGTNTGTPPPKQRLGIRTLKSAADVRRQLAKLTKVYLADGISAEKYKAVVYGLTNLLKAVELETVEAELQELKKQGLDLS